MIWLVLICLVFVIGANTHPTMTSEDLIECSVKGPNFWCQSESNAKQCNAAHYCSKRIWSKNRKTLKKNDVCELCEKYVRAVHDVTLNSQAVTQMMNVMKSICSMQSFLLQTECRSAVDRYGQLVIQAFVTYTTNSNKLCSMVRFCPGHNQKEAKLSFLQSLLKYQKVDSNLCLTCQQYVGTIHMLIANNETKMEILNYIKSACSLLPTVSSECTVLINIYGPQVVDWLVQYTADPRQFCTLISLCEKISIGHKLVQSATQKDLVKFHLNSFVEMSTFQNTQTSSMTIGCELCNVMIGYLDSILKENSTKTAIKGGLYQLCNILPASLSEQCAVLVSEYFDQVITLFIDEIKDTTELCMVKKLCSPKLKSSVQRIKHYPSNGASCESCEVAMAYLGQILQGNESKNEIRSVLTELCHYLPSGLKDQCVPFINQYSSEIVDLIVNKLKRPDQICKQLGLCSTKAFKKPVPLSTISCELCEVAMGYLDGMLKGNQTKEAVTQALDSLCSYLPTQYSSECKSFVDAYAPAIIEILVQELADPSSVCKQLGLCSTKAFKKPVPLSTVSCELCEVAMGYLDGMLKGNQTKEAVTQALDSLCSYLPTQYSSECKSFVDAYAPAIIEILVQELADPSSVCKQLGLCSTKAFKKPVPLSTVSCELCEVAMGYLDGMLKGNQTKEAVTQALDSLCSYLPTQYSSECKSFVDAYAPAIIEILVQELADPSSVCKQLGLCSTKAFKKPVPLSTVSCELCEVAMGYLDGMLKGNQTKEAVTQALDSLCSYLPTQYSSECKSFVDAYAPAIIEILVQELADPSSVCKQLGLCSTKAFKKPVPLSTVSCELCEVAMGYLDGMLKGNQTKEAVTQALDSLCSYLPTQYSSECKSFVDAYAPAIIEILVQELADPSSVCKQLGLCSTKAFKKPVPLSTVSCELCEVAMGYLDGMLKGNQTKEAVTQALDSLCSYLPTQYSSECKSFVDAYAPAIIEILVQELADPSSVCKQLGLCSTKAFKKPVPLSTVSCELCEVAMGYLDGMLKGNQTKEAVTQALDSLCSYLPTQYSSECKSFVDAYAPAIIEILVQELADPSSVCKQLGLCSTKAFKKPVPLSTVSCELCEVAMGYLDGMLKGNQTKEAVTQALDSLCSYLPTQYSSECKSFVDAYAPAIIEILVQELADPSSVCKQLGLCSTKAFKKPVPLSTVSCELCEVAMGYLDGMLKGNQTKEAVTQALDSLCSYLPTQYSSECKSFVDAYAPAIIEILVQELADPSSVCKQLGLCSTKAFKKPVPLSTVSCELCEVAMGYLDGMLKGNQTKEAVTQALDSLCSYLPTQYSSECKSFVDAYAPAIIEILVQELADPSSVCKQLGLCSTKAFKKPVPLSTVSCELCEVAMGYLDGMLKGNQTKEAVTQALDSLCSYLPTQYSSECKSFVDAYAPAIIEILVQELADPSSVCKQLGLCSTKAFKKPVPLSTVSCELCEVAMGYLDGMLKGNQTKEAVTQALDSLCSYLPTQYSSECKSFVDAYAPAIIEILVQELADPSSVCKQLGLCSTKAFKKPVPLSTVSCELCEVAMGYLDGMLKGNQTKEAVTQALDSLCSYLPTQYSSECKSFVDAYAPAIIEILVQELADPSSVCKQLGLCSTKAFKKPVPLSTVSCELCEVAMGYLDGMLKGNQTKEAVTQALDSLCSYLPTQYSSECKSFVDAYAPAIIEILVQELADPSSVCKQLGLCSTKAFKKPVPLSTVSCELCEVAMGYLDGMLKGNQTKEAVTQALDSLCSYLPTQYSSECKSFVDAYAPAIIEILVQELADPSSVCKQLGLCSTKAFKKPVPLSTVSCELCEVAMGYLDGMLKGNQTKEAVTQALDSLCSYLPTQYSSECKSFVDAYAPAIIEILVQELADPSSVCKQLGLCSTKAFKKPVPLSTVSCELCEVAMGYLDGMLKGNQTKEAVTQALDSLCSYLPTQYSSECKSFVDAYAPAIIEILVQELADPSSVCKQLGLCSTKAFKKPVPLSTVSCELCEVAMGYLDGMLKGNQTKEAVTQALDSLCSYLPTQYSSECKSFVDAYAPAIIEILVQELADPSSVCKQLGLCSTKATQVSFKGVSCEVCEYALGYLDSLIQSNSTEVKIEHAVEKLCSYLPSAIKNECDALITQYGDELIQLIVKQLKPAFVCQKLKLC